MHLILFDVLKYFASALCLIIFAIFHDLDFSINVSRRSKTIGGVLITVQKLL